MLYAEASWSGPDITGYRNPTPQHAQHCADREEHLRRMRRELENLFSGIALALLIKEILR